MSDIPILGDLTIDLRAGEYRWRGELLRFSRGEYRVVGLLVAHVGHWQSYRAIYDALRDRPGFVAGRGPAGHHTNVRSAVRRIRGQFRDTDPSFDRIENWATLGYRWRSGG